jgi:hypothetical protein
VKLAYIISQRNIDGNNQMVRHNNRRSSRTKLQQREELKMVLIAPTVFLPSINRRPFGWLD